MSSYRRNASWDRTPRIAVTNQKGKLLYSWEQNPNCVKVFLPLPEDQYCTTFCDIARNFVQVGATPEGHPCQWLLRRSTGGPVDSNKSEWKSHDEIELVLIKAKQGSIWKVALLDDRADKITTPRSKVGRKVLRSTSSRSVASERINLKDDRADKITTPRSKVGRNVCRSTSSRSVASERINLKDDRTDEPTRPRSKFGRNVCRSTSSRSVVTERKNLKDDRANEPTRSRSKLGRNLYRSESSRDVGSEPKTFRNAPQRLRSSPSVLKKPISNRDFRPPRRFPSVSSRGSKSRGNFLKRASSGSLHSIQEGLYRGRTE